MNAASTFIGHERQWTALAQAFAKNAVPQTLLISGPPLSDKRELARRFAQLLMCPNVQNRNLPASTLNEVSLPAPCGTCRVCHQIEIETFPDFRVFRPIIGEAKDEKDWIVAPRQLEGSIITVAMARKFGDEAMRRPSVGARKVMLIEQAERMNGEAQNALLKTFEEPVPGLTIVLLCDNPSQLLATVISRCWHLPLGLVADEKIAERLALEFPAALPPQIAEALRVATGRPGAARQELQRLLQPDEEEASETPISRLAGAQQMVERITRAQPVGALALTEETLRLARVWWDEDQSLENTARGDLKKAEAKINRSAAARFLDELANAYRVRWRQGLQEEKRGVAPAVAAQVWGIGLDQIRKTRHYILRNANTNLALDVMFGTLISHQMQARRNPSRASVSTVRARH